MKPDRWSTVVMMESIFWCVNAGHDAIMYTQWSCRNEKIVDEKKWFCIMRVFTDAKYWTKVCTACGMWQIDAIFTERKRNGNSWKNAIGHRLRHRNSFHQFVLRVNRTRKIEWFSSTMNHWIQRKSNEHLIFNYHIQPNRTCILLYINDIFIT